jgi:hypothetical protein
VAGGKSAVADEVTASENGLGKPESEDSGPVAGVAGRFGSNRQHSCGHGYPQGEGCYLCDPDHPYRLQEVVKE